MDSSVSVREIVTSLSSEDDAVRKKAVFRLQSLIGDPSFTDHFIQLGGMDSLRDLCKNATGNTLAYTLASFSNLLELDQGWDYVDQDVIRRLVQFVVAQPLVNILRGAMSILAAVVSHPPLKSSPEAFGIGALGDAIDMYPNFLEMLVNRLSSADHALCANALQLINALMRDSTNHTRDQEWPKFMKRLQDLGAIKAIYVLMQSSVLQDLAIPLLEFQSLTKALLRKWRDVPVDSERPEHRRALRSLYFAAYPERRRGRSEDMDGKGKKTDPEKWNQLGFQTNNPSSEFEEVGYLGMMDFTDYVKKSEDGFQRLLLEQSNKPAEQRCPIAKASLAVTSILFDHFEIDRAETEEQQRASNYDKVFKPMLLQWSRLHTAGLQAFFRLWNTTGADVNDFNKIEELVRILVEHVVGLASRTRELSEIEQELANYELRKLRELQMELLELTHEDAWGQHLRQIKDDLRHEALQFMKEQRVRCLLQGAWFPNLPAISKHRNAPPEAPADTRTPSWRFVRLSHNRRHLYYDDFDLRADTDPSLDSLTSKIDLLSVTSVVSDISSADYKGLMADGPDRASMETIRSPEVKSTTTTTITIHGFHRAPAPSEPAHSRAQSQAHSRANSKGKPITLSKSQESNNLEPEGPLLTLHPTTPMAASEWLDGLLLLLNQAPLTAETNKLVNFIAKYGLKIRMLNVRFEEGGVGAGLDEWGSAKEIDLPDREGLDEDFYYEIGGGAA